MMLMRSSVGPSGQLVTISAIQRRPYRASLQCRSEMITQGNWSPCFCHPALAPQGIRSCRPCGPVLIPQVTHWSAFLQKANLAWWKAAHSDKYCICNGGHHPLFLNQSLEIIFKSFSPLEGRWVTTTITWYGMVQSSPNYWKTTYI